jgi:predicted membrane protein DUF2207
MDFSTMATVNGFAALALVAVVLYYLLVAVVLRIPRSRPISVARYEPPPGISPAVAGWLCERGRLPRAIAAALVSMAAKGCVKIEQVEDVVTLRRLAPDAPVRLELEEDVILRSVFHSRKDFDFSSKSPQMSTCVESFRIVLQGTDLLLPHVGLSVPAWIVSGIASAWVLISAGLLSHHSGRGLGYILFGTAACFIVAVRTLSGTLEKVASRLPGSTVPKRPWTDADTRPLWFLAGALVGLTLIGFLSSWGAALLAGSFLIVNAFFYFALQGPSPAGRKALDQLEEYKKFLLAAEADAISRRDPSDRVPDRLDLKHAYAIAFHLDLGWGEQFVTSISSAVECCEVFQSSGDDKPLSLTGS